MIAGCVMTDEQVLDLVGISCPPKAVALPKYPAGKK